MKCSRKTTVMIPYEMINAAMVNVERKVHTADAYNWKFHYSFWCYHIYNKGEKVY